MRKIFIGSFLLIITIVLVSVLVSAGWSDFFSKRITGRAVENPCTDSDTTEQYSDGRNYFVKGTATAKTAFGQSIRQDVCQTNNNLIEYYCLNKRIKSEKKPCEQGCENGACIQPTIICIDSDGSDTTQKGNVTYANEIFLDKCSGNKGLIEQTCFNNSRVEKGVNCDYMCSDGRCIPSPYTCTDSDNGPNAEQGGVTKVTSRPITNIDIFLDTCLPNKKLKEFSCGDDSLSTSSEILCETNCTTSSVTLDSISYNVSSCNPKTNSCIDTDATNEYPNGRNAKLNGTATSVDVSGRTRVGEDNCIDINKKLKEFSCENNILKSEEFDCQSIMCSENDSTCMGVCEGDRCVARVIGEEVIENVTCIFKNSNQDHQCYLAEENLFGCNGVEKCIVENVRGKTGEQKTWKSSCGGYENTTMDGKNEKIRFDCKKNQQCTDSDGGKNYSTKGTITTSFASVSDFCFSEKKLGEFYCSNRRANAIGLKSATCKNQCINGACNVVSERGLEISG